MAARPHLSRPPPFPPRRARGTTGTALSRDPPFSAGKGGKGEIEAAAAAPRDPHGSSAAASAARRYRGRGDSRGSVPGSGGREIPGGLRCAGGGPGSPEETLLLSPAFRARPRADWPERRDVIGCDARLSKGGHANSTAPANQRGAARRLLGAVVRGSAGVVLSQSGAEKCSRDVARGARGSCSRLGRAGISSRFSRFPRLFPRFSPRFSRCLQAVTARDGPHQADGSEIHRRQGAAEAARHQGGPEERALHGGRQETASLPVKRGQRGHRGTGGTPGTLQGPGDRGDTGLGHPHRLPGLGTPSLSSAGVTGGHGDTGGTRGEGRREGTWGHLWGHGGHWDMGVTKERDVGTLGRHRDREGTQRGHGDG